MLKLNGKPSIWCEKKFDKKKKVLSTEISEVIVRALIKNVIKFNLPIIEIYPYFVTFLIRTMKYRYDAE